MAQQSRKGDFNGGGARPKLVPRCIQMHSEADRRGENKLSNDGKNHEYYRVNETTKEKSRQVDSPISLNNTNTASGRAGHTFQTSTNTYPLGVIDYGNSRVRAQGPPSDNYIPIYHIPKENSVDDPSSKLLCSDIHENLRIGYPNTTFSVRESHFSTDKSKLIEQSRETLSSLNKQRNPNINYELQPSSREQFLHLTETESGITEREGDIFNLKPFLSTISEREDMSFQTNSNIFGPNEKSSVNQYDVVDANLAGNYQLYENYSKSSPKSSIDSHVDADAYSLHQYYTKSSSDSGVDSQITSNHSSYYKKLPSRSDLTESSGGDTSTSFSSSCSDEDYKHKCVAPLCYMKGNARNKRLCNLCYQMLERKNRGKLSSQDVGVVDRNYCIAPYCNNVKEHQYLCSECFKLLRTEKSDGSLHKQPLERNPEQIGGFHKPSSQIPWNTYFRTKPPEKQFIKR